MAKKKDKSEKSTKVTKTQVSKPQPQNQNLPTIMDVFSQPFLPSPWKGFFGSKGEWAPAVHVSEEKDKFVAKVELPGVHEEDVNVVVLGDMLVVEGEKQLESEVKKKGYYYSETSYGSFSRSISIPSVVDVEKITANFDKGVLEIDLPKNVDVQPKKVSVTTERKPKTQAKGVPDAVDLAKENTEK
jgi:HSP20 family protein